MPFRRNRNLPHSHIESGVATRTSTYGPNEGCEVFTVREAIHTHPSGIPIQRNTLPSAIRSTSRTAIGFLAMVRNTEGRSRSTPVVDGTPERLPGNRRTGSAQVAPSGTGEASTAGEHRCVSSYLGIEGGGSVRRVETPRPSQRCLSAPHGTSA